jgi:hypothetical protein
MSSTSPNDLATTFRSIPRRLREAQGDTPPELTATHTSTVDGLVGRAASLMRVRADAAAVGEAIDDVPADQWDEATLDQLRSIALELGTALRAIAAANPNRDD